MNVRGEIGGDATLSQNGNEVRSVNKLCTFNKEIICLFHVILSIMP